MSRVIAGIYEIEKQIGAGGGGVVYLGHHLRLEKQIVLKADKRRLSADKDALRREVDMLKGLSHTYIPQVYDFVQEDGVVYTVMDYIDGESLDKLLAKGQIPEQAQVIRWACQLLEALSYLHSQPPHGILHGDIKPANIMLRTNSDVCLIDFNIALALGEDGAVKVGFSRGYASPEHYGADYVKSSRLAAGRQTTGIKSDVQGTAAYDDKTLAYDDKTLAYDDKTLVDDDKTLTNDAIVSTDNNGMSGTRSGRSTTSGQGGVLLDVRSDIYSLGATLYHLISGHRPAQKALDVIPLGPDVCSPAVSDIIRKAMAPQPDERYQTADEMLEAFLQLHRTDKRVVRHKRHIRIAAAMLTSVFLIGGAGTFVGLKQLEQRQKALTLAEYSANALAKGDVSGAVDMALQAIPDGGSILQAPVTAEAQKALTDALGVYELSDGFKDAGLIELLSAPFDIVISPEGSRFAVVYAYEAAVFDSGNLQRVVTLSTEASALSDVAFTDEDHIIYAGDKGITAYDLGSDKTVWTGENSTTFSVSADGKLVAAVNRADNHAAIYRTSDGEKLAECSFGERHMYVAANDIFADPADYIFELNEDGSMLAVSFSDGAVIIYDLNDEAGNLIIYEESEYVHFEGGFCGKYFAYAAGSGSGSVFGLIDTEEGISLGESQSGSPYMLRAGGDGIYLANENLLVKLDPETLEQTEFAYTDSVNITGFAKDDRHILVATSDNGFSFYDADAHLMSSESCQENCDFVTLSGGTAVIGNRNEPYLRVMKLKKHDGANLCSYDPRYIHDEARISRDGKTAVLFSYEGFAVYDMEGQLIDRIDLPDAEQIYDQQFRKSEEGSWLEVIWYDGTVRCYSAVDGSLISETKGEAPDKSLYEEFYTDRYRIVSSLHDAPEVYDLKSDKPVAKLEEDSYLTYVTQLDGYILTEYVSAAGERYGLLLDGDLQTLAFLPGICDVTEDGFVFDDGAGSLRKCGRYSLQELVDVAEERF